MKLVRATLESLVVPRPAPTPEQPQGLCMDKGYDYDEVRATVAEFGFTAHIRARGEEAKALAREAGHTARRWVVERTLSWLAKRRSIKLRWCKKAQNWLALVQFACAHILCDLAIYG